MWFSSQILFYDEYFAANAEGFLFWEEFTKERAAGIEAVSFFVHVFHVIKKDLAESPVLAAALKELEK